MARLKFRQSSPASNRRSSPSISFAGIQDTRSAQALAHRFRQPIDQRLDTVRLQTDTWQCRDCLGRVALPVIEPEDPSIGLVLVHQAAFNSRQENPALRGLRRRIAGNEDRHHVIQMDGRFATAFLQRRFRAQMVKHTGRRDRPYIYMEPGGSFSPACSEDREIAGTEFEKHLLRKVLGQCLSRRTEADQRSQHRQPDDRLDRADQRVPCFRHIAADALLQHPRKVEVGHRRRDARFRV
jgi:hypothetical protein